MEFEPYTGYVSLLMEPSLTCSTVQGGPKKWSLRLKAHVFCLHLQNPWMNFHDFSRTSTPFYYERNFQIQQKYRIKWRHLAKVDNFDFTFSEC